MQLEAKVAKLVAERQELQGCVDAVGWLWRAVVTESGACRRTLR